jgi:hypothetical protein
MADSALGKLLTTVIRVTLFTIMATSYCFQCHMLTYSRVLVDSIGTGMEKTFYEGNEAQESQRVERRFSSEKVHLWSREIESLKWFRCAGPFSQPTISPKDALS